MKPCLNLTTTLRAELDEAIAAAAQAGFDSVELWIDSLERYLDTHTIDDLRSMLATHGMRVLSIGDIESITFCNPEQFDELCRRTERMAKVASALSCRTLVVSASVRPRGVDDTTVANETAAVIGKLLDIVEPHGVGLGLAFRGFIWCAVNSLEQACDAVAAHEGRRVGLVLDTFDLHATGVEPDRLRSLNPACIAVMRLCDCEDVPPAILSETARALPGEGAAQLDAMLEALEDCGFPGPFSLKVLNPRLWSLDAAEAARMIMSITEQYVHGARPTEQPEP